jgi:hypothetical protein
MKVYFNTREIIEPISVDNEEYPEHTDTELYYQIDKIVYIYSERFGEFTGSTSGPKVEEDWREISVNDIVSKRDLIKFVMGAD